MPKKMSVATNDKKKPVPGSAKKSAAKASPNAATIETENHKNMRSYIYKLTKQIVPGMMMKKDCIGTLNQIVLDLVDKLKSEAGE